jgi:hypothetical protein
MALPIDLNRIAPKNKRRPEAPFYHFLPDKKA